MPPGQRTATFSSHRLASTLYAVLTLLPRRAATSSARTPSGERASSQVTSSAARAVLSPRWCTPRSPPPRRYTTVAPAPGALRAALRRLAAQVLHAGGSLGAARIVELQPREQALPGAQVIRSGRRLQPGPQRLRVLAG